LINKDTKSDLKCDVYEMNLNSWVLLGSTETIKDNLSPEFS